MLAPLILKVLLIKKNRAILAMSYGCYLSFVSSVYGFLSLALTSSRTMVCSNSCIAKQSRWLSSSIGDLLRFSYLHSHGTQPPRPLSPPRVIYDLPSYNVARTSTLIILTFAGLLIFFRSLYILRPVGSLELAAYCGMSLLTNRRAPLAIFKYWPYRSALVAIPLSSIL